MQASIIVLAFLLFALIDSSTIYRFEEVDGITTCVELNLPSGETNCVVLASQMESKGFNSGACSNRGACSSQIATQATSSFTTLPILCPNGSVDAFCGSSSAGTTDTTTTTTSITTTTTTPSTTSRSGTRTTTRSGTPSTTSTNSGSSSATGCDCSDRAATCAPDCCCACNPQGWDGQQYNFCEHECVVNNQNYPATCEDQGSCSAEVRANLMTIIAMNTECQSVLLSGLPDPCQLDACPCWNSVSAEIGQEYLECKIPGISPFYTVNTAFAHCTDNAGTIPKCVSEDLETPSSSCSRSHETEISILFTKDTPSCTAFNDASSPTLEERCACLGTFDPAEVTQLRSYDCTPTWPYVQGDNSLGDTYDACFSDSSANAVSLIFLLGIGLAVI